MDEVVTVRRSFLNRIRGFLNLFAENCRGCLHKAQSGCLGCDNLRARLLVSEIDNVRNAKEEQYWQANPVIERNEMVLRALRQANRPLSSKEIILPNVSKQLKCYTLKRMCKKHILGSRKNDEGNYEFYILNGKHPVNENNKHTTRKN